MRTQHRSLRAIARTLGISEDQVRRLRQQHSTTYYGSLRWAAALDEFRSSVALGVERVDEHRDVPSWARTIL